MIAFIVRRLGAAVVFVLIVSISAFLLVRLAPGDATTDLKLGVASQASIAAERARLGLDRPILEQLGAWLRGVAVLDLGQSSRFGRPVGDLVADRVANTAMLAGIALFLATIIGLPLGVISGARVSGVAATAIKWTAIAVVACPPIIGTLGLLLVAASTGWLSIAPDALALPVIALALPMSAVLERLQSQATSEAAGSSFILAAAARGIPARRLIWLHGGRSSLRSVLGVYGIVIATLFSGSVAVETLTGWPGLGRLMLEALLSRDLFLIAGCALAGSVLVALGNLIADVLRVVVDPRLLGTV